MNSQHLKGAQCDQVNNAAKQRDVNVVFAALIPAVL